MPGGESNSGMVDSTQAQAEAAAEWTLSRLLTKDYEALIRSSVYKSAQKIMDTENINQAIVSTNVEYQRIWSAYLRAILSQ